MLGYPSQGDNAWIDIQIDISVNSPVLNPETIFLNHNEDVLRQGCRSEALSDLGASRRGSRGSQFATGSARSARDRCAGCPARPAAAARQQRMAGPERLVRSGCVYLCRTKSARTHMFHYVYCFQPLQCCRCGRSFPICATKISVLII